MMSNATKIYTWWWPQLLAGAQLSFEDQKIKTLLGLDFWSKGGFLFMWHGLRRSTPPATRLYPDTFI